MKSNESSTLLLSWHKVVDNLQQKANVLASSKLWRATAEEIANKYPDCRLEHQYVDSAAMKSVRNPKAFDVIVTDNLFRRYIK